MLGIDLFGPGQDDRDVALQNHLLPLEVGSGHELAETK